MTQINNTDTIAEEQLLGTLIIEPHLIGDVRSQVAESDFIKITHKQIYRTILDIFRETGTVGIDLITRELVNSGLRSDAASASAEVSTLAINTGATSMCDHYTGIVQDQARHREVGYLAQELLKASHSRDDDKARELITTLGTMRDGGRMPEPVTMTQAAIQHAEWFRRLEDGELKKFNTGIQLFDSDINALYGGGCMEGQAGIIAGYTGSGKTTVCSWIACEMARIEPTQKVHIFSLELRPEHIAAKGVQMAIKRDRIETKDREGKPIKRSEITKNAAYIMSRWADRITISEERTPAQIFARARKMRAEGSTLFVLDHLHRIKLQDPRGSTARFEYGEFLRDITDAAKDDSALWLVAGQLSRDHVKNKREPIMSDLCESAQLEQHSDFIVGIHYPDPANRKSVELRCLKNRWGHPAASQRLSVDWEHQTLETMRVY